VSLSLDARLAYQAHTVLAVRLWLERHVLKPLLDRVSFIPSIQESQRMIQALELLEENLFLPGECAVFLASVWHPW